MPLSKERMNELKRQQRNVKPKSNLKTPENVQPKSEAVKPNDSTMVYDNPMHPEPHKCKIPRCLFCDPEAFKEDYRKAFGKEIDSINLP